VGESLQAEANVAKVARGIRYSSQPAGSFSFIFKRIKSKVFKSGVQLICLFN
jgi:hypothetical protein